MESKSLNSESWLPEEILLQIFRFFSPVELWYISQVCKDWHSAARQNELWKQFLISKIIKEKSEEGVSFKNIFIKQPECRKPEYLMSDCNGYQLKVNEHINEIRKKYSPDSIKINDSFYICLERRYKDHPLVMQCIDIVYTIFQYYHERLDKCVIAFNLLHEYKIFNTIAIKYVEAYFIDDNLYKKIDITNYIKYIKTFYLSKVLNDETLARIKMIISSDNYDKAKLLLSDISKLESYQGENQEFITNCSFRFLTLLNNHELSDSLIFYAICLKKFYNNNNINLLSDEYAGIYNEILRGDAIMASLNTDAYLLLHKAGILLGSANDNVRGLLLSYLPEQRICRAQELVDHHKEGTLSQHIFNEQKKLDIETESIEEQQHGMCL